MAVFYKNTFLNHDDYMTPKDAWVDIMQYIPKDKVIWEAFYGDGKSGQYLTELGFEVVHDQDDFFVSNKGDVVVSNPPFSQCKEVLKRLIELDKPFIVILPSSKINTQYVRQLFKNQHATPLQLIIPRKRINFEKHVNGQIPDGWLNRCNFDCFYYCWKIGLPRDLIWLV
jgi:hypothetical protein